MYCPFLYAEEKEETEPGDLHRPAGWPDAPGRGVLSSYPQAVIQAQERGHSVHQEMAILIVHGVLHILGYDHEKTEMEPAMAIQEKEILMDLEKEIE